MTLAEKKASQKKPSGKSNYAKKRKWLNEHGKAGWEVPEPKPWRATK